MDSQVNEISLVVNGYQLVAKEWHKGAEKKIIALHGWLDNAASFDMLAPLLSGCHIIALDLAGHGLSDHKALQANYNIWDDLNDVLAVADSLGWEQFHLLGHSRGGMMSMLLAASMPDYIQSLILLDAIWPLTMTDQQVVDQLSRHLKDQRRVSQKRMPKYKSIDDAVDARCHSSHFNISHKAAKIIVERGLVEREGYYYWRSDPRLTTASAVKFTNDQIAIIRRSIQTPSLLLIAEEGIGAIEGFKNEFEHYSFMTHKILPGGHHFHLDDETQIIAESIIEFLH